MSLKDKSPTQLEQIVEALQRMHEKRQKTPAAQLDKEAKLDHWFKYHAPTPEQVAKYDKINSAAKELARIVFDECPPGRDRDYAHMQIRQARMTANAAIACKGV